MSLSRRAPLLLLVVIVIVLEGCTPHDVTRFEVLMPRRTSMRLTCQHRDIAVSRDGQHIIYYDWGRPTRLFAKPRHRLDAEPIAEGQGVEPFFSPDGNWIGFADDGLLLRMPRSGGTTRAIGWIDGDLRGASWTSTDDIVFATDADTGLQRIPASFGDAVPVTTPDETRDEVDHVWPEVLPDGRSVIFTVLKRHRHQPYEIAALSLETGNHHTVLVGGTNAKYDERGYLVYGHGGALYAAPFDADRLELSGSPVRIVDDLPAKATGAVNFDLTDDGTLVYVHDPGTNEEARRYLAWVDRSGREATPFGLRYRDQRMGPFEPVERPPPPLPAIRQRIDQVRVSPDGRHVAFQSNDGERDVWIWSFEEQRLFALTADPAADTFPTWTPDGQHVLFRSGRFGPQQIFRKHVHGNAPPHQVTDHPTGVIPLSVSGDGQSVIAAIEHDIELGGETIALVSHPLHQAGRAEVVLPMGRGVLRHAEISPDGRWLAYGGGEGLVVRPYPDVERDVWQISEDRGTFPVWNRTRDELVYWSPDQGLMSVTVDSDGTSFAHEPPTRLFRRGFHRGWGRSFDLSPDGRWLLMLLQDDGPIFDPRLVVVDHWVEDLAGES